MVLGKNINQKNNMKKSKTDLQKIEDVVLDLENDAEGANEHSLSTLYRTLAEILCEECDDATTLKIMAAIKDRGGFLP